jgi:hypothetical protein
MTARLLAALSCACVVLAGCATGSKFLDPRTALDGKIAYVERDAAGDIHPISNPAAADRSVTRVPMPAAVDINSTIQIGIAKAQLDGSKARSVLSPQSDKLLQRKEAVTKSAIALTEVIRARTLMLQDYERNRDLQSFLRARDENDRIETAFRNELRRLWPSADSESYNAMTRAYFVDRGTGTFQRLQEFLTREIAAIEAAHRQLEQELKSRQSTLALEAFLISHGKQPAAIHLDGYDTIKAESLVRRDPLGLDLSPEEKARLAAQMKATRELAESLEGLRRGEQTLNETLRKLASQMVPEIDALLKRADGIAAKLSAAELQRRAGETEKLFQAFLAGSEARSKTFVAAKRAELQREKDALIAALPSEARDLQKAVQNWIATGKQLKAAWEGATPSALTPETLLKLVNQSVAAAKAIEDLAARLPSVADGVEKRTSAVLETWLADLPAEQSQFLVQSPEARALQANFDAYAADFREGATLVKDVYITLARLTQPVTELPPVASTSLEIPLDRIRDTFINLEQTPRLVGDVISVRATYKSSDQVDTSIASFRVEKFGHYADLSPAVVLVKPQHIAGTDTGFRFAPALSWMYHWSPRPADQGRTAAFARTFGPAIGLHSAFLNFNTPNSTTSAQIGLGVTASFWGNRLQFGYGVNLMAKSEDEGRNYFFVGSDLIGLLQAIGLVKPQ